MNDCIQTTYNEEGENMKAFMFPLSCINPHLKINISFLPFLKKIFLFLEIIVNFPVK